MTPAFLIVTTIAVVALIASVVVIAILLGRRSRDERVPEVPAILRQIDAVRNELRGLTDLFLVPRTRGAVGETILAELLSSWLPPGSYDLQFSFSNGSRVDAVIRLGSRLVPVDSKFPLEAIQRHFARGADGAPDGATAASGATAAPSTSLPADVRKAFSKHITDIATRYINPAEGTMSFALMYIPSERVYVELFATGESDLMRSALEQSVVPVSPATLFLYLQTVAYGLRGLAIPQGTRALLDSLETLRGELGAFMKSFETAGGHLRNLSRAYDEAAGRLARVEMRVDRVTEHRE